MQFRLRSRFDLHIPQRSRRRARSRSRAKPATSHKLPKETVAAAPALKPSPEPNLKTEIVVARGQPSCRCLFILRDEKQPVGNPILDGQYLFMELEVTLVGR